MGTHLFGSPSEKKKKGKLKEKVESDEELAC